MVDLPLHQAPLALARLYLDEDLPGGIAALAQGVAIEWAMSARADFSNAGTRDQTHRFTYFA